MMSKEELMKLKEDVTEIQERLRVLTDEELEQVFGGDDLPRLSLSPPAIEDLLLSSNASLTVTLR